jgi:hypothetical protein
MEAATDEGVRSRSYSRQGSGMLRDEEETARWLERSGLGDALASRVREQAETN